MTTRRKWSLTIYYLVVIVLALLMVYLVGMHLTQGYPVR